ncbi:MAG TPA: FtsX-like permease family protein [Gammaproteobacteria bacterium]|nr:FtsX-like permease family protein [Gammaproteobacteria bacterium]
MLTLYLRAALARLRFGKQIAAINVIGLTLGFTCFVTGYVVSDYLRSADGQMANIDRIYLVEQRNVQPGDDTAKPFSPSASRRLADYIRASVPEIPAVARLKAEVVRVSAGDHAFPFYVRFADADLLRIFDLPFVAGDASAALDEPRGAVLTVEMAEAMFGTRDAVGKTFTMTARQRTADVVVRGVVAQSDKVSTLRFPSPRGNILAGMDVLDALTEGQRPDDWYGDFSAPTYALLPSDGSLSASDLERRLQQLGDRVVPRRGDTASFRVRHVSDYYDDQVSAALGALGFQPGLRVSLLLFLPALVILAMACFNYINLAVAIAVTRAKEVGMSKVLGASTRQVVERHMLEAAVAVVIGLTLGFLLAAALVAAANCALDLSVPFFGLVGLEFWLTAAAVALATTAVAGAYPAFVMSRFRPLDTLRAGSKKTGSGTLRNIFIGVQFAVASLMLTAVFVMYAQNGSLRGEAARLPEDPLVQLDNNLLETPDVDPETLTSALLASPSIGGVTGMPDGVWSTTMGTETYSRTNLDSDLPADLNLPPGTALPRAMAVELRSRAVSFDFFTTIGVALSAGRSFTRGVDRPRDRDADREGRQTGRRGLVADRDALRLLGFENPGDAVGATIYRRAVPGEGPAAASSVEYEIIGVVDRPPLQTLSSGTPNVYELDPYNSRLIVRLAAGHVPAGLAHIESTWRRLVPDSPLRAVRFVDESLEESLRTMNLLTTGLLSVVTFGFLVAVAGIFGMALFVASRRRHEIGIRKSLGAAARDILRQLLVEFGRPVLIGNVAAWPLAYMLAQVYGNLFLEAAPLTPWPYAASLALTLGIAWLGVGGQALRAARLQPARVLRYE